MTQDDSARIGQCRCGEVRFALAGEPLITMACHCTGCQRMTASAFSLSSLYQSDALSVVAGEHVIGGMKGATRHFFCPSCMSWLFTRPEGMADFVNVRATMLDDARSYRPFLETFTSEMLPWVRTGATASFERFPPMEEFNRLLSQFASRQKA